MKLTLWIDAFIPFMVAGYTRVIPAGAYRGKSAVPLPGVALLNPLNWTLHRDNGFLTDQRSFSSSPIASVRMRSRAVVELSPPALVAQDHFSSGTTQVDMVTGEVRGHGFASMAGCLFTVVPPEANGAPRTPSLVPPPPDASLIRLRLKAAASDPLVSAAADIDYEGDFVIMSSAGSRVVVEFSGKIDAFPAFEGYATYTGVTKTLFTSLPPPGNTVTNLPLSANRPVTASVTFPCPRRLTGVLRSRTWDSLQRE
jgi:hypothetical protein